ncbi:MAG: hypothetical protein ACRCYT_02650 [Cetobacterium sp.]
MYGSDLEFRFKLLKESNYNITKNFQCGNLYIDNFLKNEALKNQESKTYLIINQKKQKFEDKNYKKLLGFFTLACSAIKYSPDEGRTTNNFSAIELKYFALDKSFQGLQYDSGFNDPDDLFNFSDVVFGEILKKCQYIKENILGARYLILYSVPNSVNFYKRQFLENFNEYMEKNQNMEITDCIPMFISLDT